MNESIVSERLVFLLEKPEELHYDEQRKEWDDLSAYLMRNHLNVLRGDFDMMRRMLVEHKFLAVLVTESGVSIGPRACADLLVEYDVGSILYIHEGDTKMTFAELFEAEYNDIIHISMSAEERGARVMQQIGIASMNAQRRKRYFDLEDMYKKALVKIDEMEQLTNIDAITGIITRRYMSDKMQEEAARTLRTKRNFSVLICKIDQYQKLDTRVSRKACDRILRAVAGLLTNSCRKYDIVARWEEDSFMMLLPETDLTWAMVVAERCRNNMERFTFNEADEPIALTFSIGMTEYRQSDGVGGSVRRSEHAYKEAVNRGGNCIVFSSISGSEITYLTYSTIEQG